MLKEKLYTYINKYKYLEFGTNFHMQIKKKILYLVVLKLNLILLVHRFF